MNVLVYGSEIVSSRIKLMLDCSEVDIINVTQKITKPRDLRLLGNLRDIELAIVDATEIGAKQVCNYLARVRRIVVALLIDVGNAEWGEWGHYPVVAYIPKTAGDREFASRIKRAISRTPS